MTRFEEQSKEYHDLLEELYSLFVKKGLDYGQDSDHFINLRTAESWGVEPWVAICIRLNDKIIRLQKFAKGGKLENEGAEDSLKDIANYALYALTFLREKQKDEKARNIANELSSGSRDWSTINPKPGLGIDTYEPFIVSNLKPSEKRNEYSTDLTQKSMYEAKADEEINIADLLRWNKKKNKLKKR